MARSKTLTKRLIVDVAQRSHRCRSNKSHQVQRGSKRLKIIEGRAVQHYCAECGKKFLATDIEKMNDILRQLD